MGVAPQSVSSNGPFFLQTYTKPFFMVLKENPHFFGRGHEMGGILVGPYLNTIILEFNPNIQKSLNELAKGKIDFIWWDLPLDFVPRISQIPHVTLYGTDRTGYDYLTFNLERDPYADPAFRHAVALLVNRDQIVRRVLKGQGTPVYSVIPPKNTFWSNPNVVETGAGLTTEERIKQAGMILQKAGYSWDERHLVLPRRSKNETHGNFDDPGVAQAFSAESGPLDQESPFKNRHTGIHANAILTPNHCAPQKRRF